MLGVHRGGNVLNVAAFTSFFPLLSSFVILNLVVNCLSSADVRWHLAALEFITMRIVKFPFTSEHDVAGFSYYDPRISQCSCEVLGTFAADERLRVDRYDFAYFVLGFALDSSFAYLAEGRSGDLDWSSVGTFPF